MKYFYDCEFLEGKQKNQFPLSIFKKETVPTINLISIGIVAEDGREYSAISKDFNLKEAWNRYDLKETSTAKKYMGIYEEKVYWIRENVLKPLWRQFIIESEQEWYAYASEEEYADFLADIRSGEYDKNFNYKNFKQALNKYGKSNEHIAQEVRLFCDSELHLAKKGFSFTKEEASPKLYGYYSAYDHVVFCWLFGKMMDLPSNFPMYTRDLKHMLDEKVDKDIFLSMNQDKDRPATFEEKLEKVKTHYDYPTQDNEHLAIDDAWWNKKLYEFIEQL